MQNNKNGDWKAMLSCLQSNGVNFGDADAEQAYKNLKFVFGTKPYVANAKCQQIKWLCGFMKLSDSERDDFGTDICYNGDGSWSWEEHGFNKVTWISSFATW